MLLLPLCCVFISHLVMFEANFFMGRIMLQICFSVSSRPLSNSRCVIQCSRFSRREPWYGVEGRQIIGLGKLPQRKGHLFFWRPEAWSQHETTQHSSIDFNDDNQRQCKDYQKDEGNLDCWVTENHLWGEQREQVQKPVHHWEVQLNVKLHLKAKQMQTYNTH